jgi:hypothetical protein
MWNEKYIEVKTTTGNQSGEFYVTANELQFSRQHSDKFYLYRVYDYDDQNNRGKFFAVKGSHFSWRVFFDASGQVC